MSATRHVVSRPLPHLALTLLVCLAAILILGCAVQKAAEPVLPLAAGVRQDGVLTLTRNDNDRSAELRVGERLQLSLPENPTTGYTWAIEETDRGLLALDSTAYEESTEGFIGARGRRLFTFSARQPGEVALKLKYWRFWEGDSSTTEHYAVQLRILP